MKKILVILLALMMVLSLVACDNGTDDPKGTGNADGETEDPLE